jgi:hypothetical protein
LKNNGIIAKLIYHLKTFYKLANSVFQTQKCTVKHGYLELVQVSFQYYN